MADYIVYDTVPGLIAASEASRGEGKVWRAGSTELTEAASGASDHIFTNAAGVKFYVMPRGGVISTQDMGLVSGADIGARVLAVWNWLGANDGGTIFVSAGEWESANIVLPRKSVPMAVVFQPGARVYPSNPTTATYIWDFTDNGGVIDDLYLNGLYFWGQTTPGSGVSSPREDCFGVRVGHSNKLRIEYFQGRFIGGRALTLMRPFNATARGVYTYRSGNASPVDPAFYVTGEDDGATGDAFNDLVMSEIRSERDLIGPWFENCSAGLQCADAMKIHGAPTDCERGLTIIQCRHFDLKAVVTLGCVGTPYVYVGDAAASINPITASGNAPTNTRGRLELELYPNFTPTGDTTDFKILEVELDDSQSEFYLSGRWGLTPGVSGSGSTVKGIHLTAGGSAGARIDLSGVIPNGFDVTNLVEDARGFAREWQVVGTYGSGNVPPTVEYVTP